MLEVLFGLRIRTNVSVRSFSSKVVNAMDFRGQVGFFIISNNLYNSFIMNSIRMLIEIEFLDAIRNCIEFIFVGFEFAYNEQILQIYQSVAYNSQLLNIQKLTQNRVVGFSKEFLCLFLGVFRMVGRMKKMTLVQFCKELNSSLSCFLF